jgi:hypothetical protein
MIDNLRKLIEQRISEQKAAAPDLDLDENPSIDPGALPTIRAVGFSVDERDRFVVDVELRNDYGRVPVDGLVVAALLYATPDFEAAAHYFGRYGDIPFHPTRSGRRARLLMDEAMVREAHEGEPEVVIGFGVAGNKQYDLYKRVTERFHRKARKYLSEPRNPGPIPEMPPIPEPREKDKGGRGGGSSPVEAVSLKERTVVVPAGSGSLFNFPFRNVPYSIFAEDGLALGQRQGMAYVDFVRPAPFDEEGTAIFLRNPTGNDLRVTVVWLDVGADRTERGQ